MLVELKNGETLNGHLVTCDTWMNLTLREVVQTSPVGFRLSFLGLVGLMGMGMRERSWKAWRIWRAWEGETKKE